MGLSPSLNPDYSPIYQLYAIIVHEGTIDQGHYLSYCKSDGEWYEYNDDLVIPVATEQVINNKNAYLLFYQLKEQWCVQNIYIFFVHYSNVRVGREGNSKGCMGGDVESAYVQICLW